MDIGHQNATEIDNAKIVNSVVETLLGGDMLNEFQTLDLAQKIEILSAVTRMQLPENQIQELVRKVELAITIELTKLNKAVTMEEDPILKTTANPPFPICTPTEVRTKAEQLNSHLLNNSATMK